MKTPGEPQVESIPATETATATPREARTSPAGEDDAATRRPLILIADDDELVLKTWENKLKADGFDVVAVSSSVAVARVARERRPDLIVLDINFPPEYDFTVLMWNGFTILQWLKRFKEAANTPIILISGGDGLKYRDQALAEGASGFYHKDADHRELLALIHQLIAGKTGAVPA